jgi:hypothetical protein
MGVALLALVAVTAWLSWAATARYYEPLLEAHAAAAEENARLHRALAIFTRHEGPCAVRESGPPVLCQMRTGYVARRELLPGEVVVLDPMRPSPPLKRAKRRRTG